MEYTKQIERYIEGEMEGEELEAFRKEMSGNPQLSALVEDAGRIQKAGIRLFAGDPGDLNAEVEEAAGKDVASYRQESGDPLLAEDIRKFRERLEQVEKECYGQHRSRSRTFLKERVWYYAAAMIILAVAISLLLDQYRRHLTCPAIYQDHYMAYSGSGRWLDQTRSDNDFLHAVEVYEAGEYQDALRLFEPFIASEEYGAYALFYSGLASMGMERYTEAFVYLHGSLKTAKEELTATTRWYLGLCYLAVNDAGAALAQFETAGLNPEYSKKAGKIIKKIRKIPGFDDP